MSSRDTVRRLPRLLAGMSGTRRPRTCSSRAPRGFAATAPTCPWAPCGRSVRLRRRRWWWSASRPRRAGPWSSHVMKRCVALGAPGVAVVAVRDVVPSDARVCGRVQVVLTLPLGVGVVGTSPVAAQVPVAARARARACADRRPRAAGARGAAAARAPDCCRVRGRRSHPEDMGQCVHELHVRRCVPLCGACTAVTQPAARTLSKWYSRVSSRRASCLQR